MAVQQGYMAVQQGYILVQQGYMEVQFQLVVDVQALLLLGWVVTMDKKEVH